MKYCDFCKKEHDDNRYKDGRCLARKQAYQRRLNYIRDQRLEENENRIAKEIEIARKKNLIEKQLSEKKAIDQRDDDIDKYLRFGKESDIVNSMIATDTGFECSFCGKNHCSDLICAQQIAKATSVVRSPIAENKKKFKNWEKMYKPSKHPNPQLRNWIDWVNTLQGRL